MRIPSWLDWWHEVPGGAEWLASLPSLVEACAERWSLYLGLDRERMRRWGIAHALAWGVSGGKLEGDMIECARLLLAARS